MKKDKNDILVVRKASHEYTMLKTLTAGVKLEGWMVKAIRAGRISISGSAYVRPEGKGMSLHGVHIKPLEHANSFTEHNSDPVLTLLFNKKEIDNLVEAEQRDGCTIVLRRLFWDKHLVKAEIWLAKGKKMHDKRQSVKERDDKRDADRAKKQAA